LSDHTRQQLDWCGDMKVLWVFAHPERRSLNGSLRDAGVRALEAAGHEVRQSDLYAMSWKAVADGGDFADMEPGARLTYAASSFRAFKGGTQTADVAAEQEKLMWADAVLIQFPLWWFSVPAILKGWLDRVLAAGWAYRVTDPANPKRSLRYGEGNLRGRRGMLSRHDRRHGRKPRPARRGRRHRRPAVPRELRRLLVHRHVRAEAASDPQRQSRQGG
jgi:NAD(P)H dehydrogenase (quinone)